MTGSKLTKSDYLRAINRSYFLQNGFNYSNYQGLGYANVLFPALRKIHTDDKAFAEELKKNIGFYNTNPNLLPFVTSLHLVMSDNGLPYEEISGIKMALMGPLAGIGDSLSQFALAPLYSTICASLGLEGVIFAPLLFLLLENGTLYTIKYFMGMYGYNVGTSIIDKLSEKMGKISQAANIIGLTVIAGLAATFVKMNVNIKFAAGKVAEGVKQQTVDIQALLDKVAPALLPVLYTALMYYLIKKKGLNTYQLVFITIILGCILSALHILV